MAPNQADPNVPAAARGKPVRRAKKSRVTRAATRAGVGVGIDIESAGESANVSVADTAAGAKKGAVRPRSSSPRAHKQQKLSAGEAAVLLHCTGLCPEGNWKSISPPLPRVQERHDAFEVHAQAVRDRGPSRLQAASNPAGREAALFERLAKGIAHFGLDHPRQSLR